MPWFITEPADGIMLFTLYSLWEITADVRENPVFSLYYVVLGESKANKHAQ